MSQQPRSLGLSTALKSSQFRECDGPASVCRFGRLGRSATAGAPASMPLLHSRLMSAFLIPEMGIAHMGCQQTQIGSCHRP